MKIEKPRGRRLAVSTVLLLSMAFSNVTWAVFPKTVSADTSSDVTSKQNELKTLQQQIEETRSQLFTKKKEESNALAALENIAYFGAMLAVNLAVVNLLPIPALDGGRIFFLVISTISLRIFRKKIPMKYEAAIHFAGFALLMVLILVVTFNDVVRLFG